MTGEWYDPIEVWDKMMQEEIKGIEMSNESKVAKVAKVSKLKLYAVKARVDYESDEIIRLFHSEVDAEAYAVKMTSDPEESWTDEFYVKSITVY